MRIHFTSFLVAVLPVALAACASESTSTKGQLITCQTDPDTNVILSCKPGDDSGGGGSHSCTDVDEDGDGEPGDDNPTVLSHGDGDDDDSGDSDHDGVGDDDDCDEHPGEDGDDDSGVDLPYDIKMTLGTTYTPIVDAFAENGMQPAAILSVTGATWRAAELAAGTPFAVTQADCDHAGNRDAGRDRVVVTWQNADGSTDADHLDLRYCD